MEKGVENQEFEYIVDLPSSYDLCFNIATPQYRDLSKRALTTATTPKGAVGNVVFRGTENRDVGRRIMAALRDSKTGTESYAFEIPEVRAEDGKSLSQFEMELSMEGFLAQEIADKRKGIAEDHLPYARELLEFRKKTV